MLLAASIGPILAAATGAAAHVAAAFVNFVSDVALFITTSLLPCRASHSCGRLCTRAGRSTVGMLVRHRSWCAAWCSLSPAWCCIGSVVPILRLFLQQDMQMRAVSKAFARARRAGCASAAAVAPRQPTPLPPACSVPVPLDQRMHHVASAPSGARVPVGVPTYLLPSQRALPPHPALAPIPSTLLQGPKYLRKPCKRTLHY